MENLVIGQFRKNINIGIPINKTCCDFELEETVAKFYFSMKKNNKPLKLPVFVCSKCKKIYLDVDYFYQHQMMMTTELFCTDTTTGKIYKKYKREGPSVKGSKSTEESIKNYKRTREFSIRHPFQGGDCSGK